MRKSDLKDGMVVEYRNGLRRFVLGDKLLGEHGNANIEEYDEELKYIDGESTLDIVKVYTVESSLCVAIGSIFLNKHLNLIWERVKEIDWAKVPFGTWVIVADHKEELNVDDGEYVMFVGYEPKLENWIKSLANRPVEFYIDGKEMMRTLAPHQSEFDEYSRMTSLAFR